MPRRLALVALLAVFALTPQKSSAADWIRLRSAHVTFEGDIGEKKLREVAERLEQFRDMLGRSLRSAKLVMPTPLTVVVFDRARDFKAVAPLFEGKPIEASGYAAVGPIGSSIVICNEGGDEAYSILYHEFSHLLISNVTRGLPLWYEEGLAEFYRTFQVLDDGHRAVVGKAVTRGQVTLLRDELLPMSEFLATDRGSRLYNVGTNRLRYYAQSWALVHYLMLGNPDRTRQLGDFLNQVKAGIPADKAFTNAFPRAETLGAELADYVEQSTIPVIQRPFPDGLQGAAGATAIRMTPAESLASTGLALARQQRFPEAEVQLEKALALDPRTASAQIGLGLLRVVQDRPLDALAPLRKGVELDERNPMAHFALGLAALRCGVAAGCDAAPGGRDEARRAFARAVELLPEFPDALADLGFVEMASGADLAGAERHVLAAVTYLPGRDDYRFYLAQVYLRQRDFPKAQAALGSIVAASPNAAIKAQARQLLGEMAQQMRDAAARGPARGGAPADAGALTAARGAAPPPPGAPPTGNGLIPVYRQIGPGEHRVEATLSAIECSRAAIIVVIGDVTGPRRFSAPSFDAIDFITYREDVKGKIVCGPQGGAMRVYLTWRAPAPGEPALLAGTEGRVVAIEYLPVK